MRRFVIVGGGLAGHKAATTLRRCAPEASITLVGEEPGVPYDRTTLSKAVLRDRVDQAIGLADLSHYDQDLLHRPATRVKAVDPRAHAITTDRGETLLYDRLLLATGSRARRLPFAVPETVHPFYLRTFEDALRLGRQLAPRSRVAVIGGGFIGLEVAAAARAHGSTVTVLEAAPRLLARGMPPIVADWMRSLHEANGIDIRCGVDVERIDSAPGGVVLGGGDWRVPADVVVVGIGVVPNVELARDAGLAVENGLVVDAQCRTSEPDIYGAGEVTSHPTGRGDYQRIESWRHAGEQGVVAARAMLGEDVRFDEIPWLWSDQFDVNLQALGVPAHARRFEVLGDARSDSWTWVGLDDADRVVAAIALNRGRDISMLRRAMRNNLGLPMVPTKIPA